MERGTKTVKGSIVRWFGKDRLSSYLQEQSIGSRTVIEANLQAAWLVGPAQCNKEPLELLTNSSRKPRHLVAFFRW